MIIMREDDKIQKNEKHGLTGKQWMLLLFAFVLGLSSVLTLDFILRQTDSPLNITNVANAKTSGK